MPKTLQQYMFAELPECSIIGGSEIDILVIACRLRRRGISVFTDLGSRKRSKAFKRASDNNRWGNAGVYDLDDASDFEYLSRENAFREGGQYVRPIREWRFERA